MNDYTYSVAIRTLGTSNDKYEKLIKSIIKQRKLPEKIVVVVPEGYEFPSSIAGNELFVRSEKGMLYQRAAALDYIDSDLVLFSDDDIEFEDGFVDKLADPLMNHNYSCAAGPLLSFFPPRTFKYFLASALGGACVMLKGRENNYVRILRTGGWSYNYDIDIKSHKFYNTESFAGTCFMAKTKDAKSISFIDEAWCEQKGYAAFEDRIFAYKMIVNDYKCCIVSDAEYIHNDGKASTKELKSEPSYSRTFNHYVFWHRYIYSLSNSVTEKIRAKICINYYTFIGTIYNLGLIMSRRIDREFYKAKKDGLKDAKAFIKSKDYKCLNSTILR